MTRVLLVNACLLITFGNAGRLDLLTGLEGWRIATTPRAVSEVSKRPAAGGVRAAVRSGLLERVQVDIANPEEQGALAKYDRSLAFRGRADAEILALAVCRQWTVGSDDAAVRAEVVRSFGPQKVYGTLDIIVTSVRSGRLDASAADQLLPRLDVGPTLLKRLASAGISLAELLE